MSTRRPLLCIDLTAEEMTGIEVIGSRVKHWFTHELLPGSIAGGVPTDAKRLAGQLRTSLATAGITARRARVTISDAALLTRIVHVPRMPSRDLSRAASYAAERELPIAAAQRVWSWKKVKGSDGSAAILLIAGWRDALDRVQAAIESAGLEVEFIESRSVALSRSIARDRALVIELSAGTVRATAIAKGQVPTSMHAKAPENGDGWADVIQPILLSARRQVGKRGEDLPVLITQGLERAMPEAIWARPVGTALALHGLQVPPELSVHRYLAPIGLALANGDDVRLRAPAARNQPAKRRVSLAHGGNRWVPGLAILSLVSWTTAAAGAAVLFGWHPFWPLAP